ncbi:MAG: class I SAM-dependent methyltransferase [Phycisphaerales bacterium]|nr:MAG: class I SAM-dependent methyltransferase [Phycisphaerales bacterium]
MTPTPTIAIDSVEHWNDTFARQHDIDDYYSRSGLLIRWIEQQRLACIRSMVAAKPSDRILEVGCGGGHVLRQFPESDLTGVDVSGEMLAKARRNLQGYRAYLLKGELQELDLPDAGFDKVICTEVLEHAVDPEAILAQIKCLVRTEGRLVITFPNDPLVNRLKGFIRSSGLTILPPFRRISWGGDQYHLHVWRVGEMRALLSRYFAILRERFIPSRLLPIRCCFQCASRA